jgi:Homeodomain-like domain
MKNARERMDVLAAYREVGSYRGAAQLCGTTHKTVKRILERHNAGGAVPPRQERVHNYDQPAASSADVTYRPGTSRWPSALSPVAIRACTFTTRPPSRTFSRGF